MTNPTILLRGLITYGIALPVAIFLGYLLASPADWGSFIAIGLVLGLLVLPLFLKWYHPMVFLCWNMPAVIFILPGRPEIWLFAAGTSFVVAIAQRTISPQMQLNPAPLVFWPLLFLLVVVITTAQMTGGIGLGSWGGATSGGRRYIYVVGAVIGYIAMSSRQIPPDRALFYVGLYYLGALGYLSTDLVHFAGGWLEPLLYVFPTETGSWTLSEKMAVARDYGLSAASASCLFYLIARYGIKEMLSGRHSGKVLLAFLCVVGSIAGGYRSMLLVVAMVLFFVFVFEGLHRSRYAVMAGGVGFICMTLMIPFARHLPMPIQRSLSVVPIIDVDPLARLSAEGTSEWRLQMWKDLMPEIPQYFWLGKGLGLNTVEFSSSVAFEQRGQMASEETFKMSADYHNGPLSVIIPFGIWGVIGLIWLWTAGLRALYLNYQHGSLELKRVNRFLIAMFLTKMIMFLFVFGGFAGELSLYSGILGLSVSLNGGVCRPSLETAKASEQIPPRPVPLRRLTARPVR